jgi:hypothetical protein
MRLADITRHVDQLTAKFTQAIEAVLDGKTAEQPYIGALFDCSDPQGMEIYFEVGLQPGGNPGSYLMLSVLQEPLDQVLAKHNCVPIDETPSYVPGTILLYVFTRGVVVARRYETFAGVRRGLREVRLMRDVQFDPTGLRLEGGPALTLIVQRCGQVLRRLWDRGTDRVALIDWASHGAKAGYIERKLATETLERLSADATGRDRDDFREMAARLAAGGRPGEIDCIVQGFGPLLLIALPTATFEPSHPAKRPFGKEDEELLAEYVAACRDRTRALRVFEKALDKLKAGPAQLLVAELLAALRHDWDDCDAILARVEPAIDALRPSGMRDVSTVRLWLALNGLSQATTDRKRGGAINAVGGSDS